LLVNRRKISWIQKYIAKNQLDLREEWIICDRYLVESGASGMQKILALKDRPNVVMCANDTLAIGSIKQVFQFGLKVPDDVSVTGFDDIFISRHFLPGITTVKQNYARLAELAVKKVIAHIPAEHSSKETLIDAETVIRDSCRIL
jgi:DNA-binding LacI/PurR family transcriptional regulator